MKFKIIFLLLLFPYSLNFPLSQEDDSKILATIENHTISLDAFSNRYTDYIMSSGVSDNIVVRSSILNNMVNEILLRYFDNNETILNNPEYQKEIEWNKKQVLLSYLKDLEIHAKITASEQEVRKAFIRFNEKIAASHLYAENEEQANNLYELLKIGVDFELLAQQVFSDSVLKNNGGYLGYFSWGDMDPAFEEAIYEMGIGEFSKPVKTEYGYSIIKLEDKVTHPLLTEHEFLQKKNSLERSIKISKKKASEREYLKNVLDINNIVFNEKSLDDIINKFNGIIGEKEKSGGGFPEIISAEYKDQKVSQEEIENRLLNLPHFHRKKITGKENLKAIIKGFFLQDELIKIAIEKDYDKDPLINETIEKINNNIFLKYKFDEITYNFHITDSVLNDFYSMNIDKFSSERELNLQEIIVNNKELADSLLLMIKNGDDFGQLANEHSLRTWSAENDGIVGFAPIKQFGSYGEYFWESEVGEVIGPLKIESSYGIFRILGKNDSKPIEFEKIKSEVIKGAQFEKKSEIVMNYIDSLRGKINVEVNNELLHSYNILDLVFSN
jgi:parvulin-like peptidyl-prolyl isomerase